MSQPRRYLTLMGVFWLCCVTAASTCLAAETPAEMFELVKRPGVTGVGFDEQIELLERLRQEAPDFPETLAVMGMVAVRAGDHGHSDLAHELWHELAAYDPWEPPPDSGRAGFWAETYVQGAARALARHHEERGEWEEALTWWRRFEPQFWCGNATDMARSIRDWRIGEMLLKLGEEDEALEVWETAIIESGVSFDIGPVAAWLRLCHQRGELDDARERLAAAHEWAEGVRMAREVLSLLDAQSEGRLTDLWREGFDRYSRMPPGSGLEAWRPRVAFELLLRTPRRTLALARSRLDADCYDESAWAVMIITALRPAGGLSITRALLDPNRGSEDDHYRIRPAFFALQAMGDDLPAGSELVAQVAAGEGEFAGDEYARARSRAQEVLDRYPTPAEAREAVELGHELPAYGLWEEAALPATSLYPVVGGVLAAIAAASIMRRRQRRFAQ